LPVSVVNGVFDGADVGDDVGNVLFLLDETVAVNVGISYAKALWKCGVRC
jgi:hypothetical protein